MPSKFLRRTAVLRSRSAHDSLSKRRVEQFAVRSPLWSSPAATRAGTENQRTVTREEGLRCGLGGHKQSPFLGGRGKGTE